MVISEDVLPGTWEITELQIARQGRGVEHNDKIILNDTTLENVGIITIPTFNFEDLDLQVNGTPLDCSFELFGEERRFFIDNLFVVGSDLICYFREGGVKITDESDSAIKKFMDSSSLFRDNYEVEFEEVNKVILTSLSGKNIFILEK